MRSKQRIIGLWHDFTCKGWLWDQAFPTLLKHWADLFNLFVDKHVVFRRQSFIECIARFEVKKNKALLFTLENYIREMLHLLSPFFWFHTFHPFFCWSPTSCLTIGKSSTKIPPPFEAVLTLLSARPKAAAPSVAHGLRPLVVAFFGVGKTGRRWNSAGVSQKYLKSLELSM